MKPTTIPLEPYELSLAAILVLALAALTWHQRLGVAKQLLVAALRTSVQLTLIGLVLKALFESVHLGWMTLIAIIMLLAAAREVKSRQTIFFLGWWGLGIGTVAMFVSTFSITIIALTCIVQPEPWYMPQYSIPLLGMMAGNTLTGIALALDRLVHEANDHRITIENRLSLGHSWQDSIEIIRKNAARSGMIPIINAMAAAGLISLPGMMTGQILAGNPPEEAVKYQILIMFMLTAGTGFGVLVALYIGARRLFDDRTRLRLDRLQAKKV